MGTGVHPGGGAADVGLGPGPGARVPVEVEGSVDERIDGCRGAAKEEDRLLQVAAHLLAGIEEHEDEHGDVVWGPADEEGADDDHRDQEGPDFRFPQDLLPGVFDGRA